MYFVPPLFGATNIYYVQIYYFPATNTTRDGHSFAQMKISRISFCISGFVKVAILTCAHTPHSVGILAGIIVIITPHTVMRNLRHHRLNASMPVPRCPTVSAANPDTKCFFTAFSWPFCSLTVNNIACLKGVSLVSLVTVGVLNLLNINRIPIWKFFTVPICESDNYS